MGVISWQSNVLSRVVGNNVARLVYPIMEVPAFFLDSVLFAGVASSNKFGMVFESEEWLNFYRSSLEMFVAQEIVTIHTGFFGSDKQMEVLRNFCNEHPDIFLVVDPVMADYGRIFVREDVAKKMPELVQHAQIITPNLTELEVLTQKKIKSTKDVFQASDYLLDTYPLLQGVVVTSIPCSDGYEGALLLTLNREKKVIRARSLNISLPGTGDLFCALLVCYLYKHYSLENAFIQAFQKTWLWIYSSYQAKEKNLSLARGWEDVKSDKWQSQMEVVIEDE